MMKKIIHISLFICMAALLTSFAGTEYKDPLHVKVTVRIDRLKAISKDACNAAMDFKGTITIYKEKKSFPVMEGNNITPGWEFTTTSIQKWINIKIDIRDDDDALCGGGDDVVVVNPNGSQTISLSLNPKEPGAKTTILTGKKVSGKEQAEIKFTTIIVPL